VYRSVSQERPNVLHPEWILEVVVLSPPHSIEPKHKFNASFGLQNPAQRSPKPVKWDTTGWCSNKRTILKASLGGSLAKFEQSAASGSHVLS
jgi:hypothetical protein